MKKVLRSFIVFICLFTAVNSFVPTKSEANTVSEKKFIISIIHTIENGRHYLVVLLDGWIISKAEEL